MEKKIKIACKGAAEMELQTLVPMQGDLKDLSEENYEKLKKEIIELGFSEPISVWIDPEGQAKLLNGHQRTRVLHKMRDDGWVIPPLPVSIVEAESHQQAMKKILSLTSQYGEITKDGLYKFMNEAQLSMDDIAASFRFPEINFETFNLEFFKEENTGAGESENGKMSDKFLVAPFTVLNAREGWWQERKRQWIALGIKSELGRGGELSSAHKSQERLDAFRLIKTT